MTSIREALKLTCIQCGSTHATRARTYEGLPISKWWANRGRMCRSCFEKRLEKSYRQLEKEQVEAAATLEDHFREFHHTNPAVYEALVREGRALLERGHRKLGMGMLYERLRWQVYMETVDDQYDWKLPNNYRAYYARLIMEQEREFAGVFNTAELRSRRYT